MLARVADGYRRSKKTFNNAVSVLRRAFDFGYRNHPQHINPAIGLHGSRMSRKDRIRPDPFRIGEAEQLIAATAPSSRRNNYGSFGLGSDTHSFLHFRSLECFPMGS